MGSAGAVVCSGGEAGGAGAGAGAGGGGVGVGVVVAGGGVVCAVAPPASCAFAAAPPTIRNNAPAVADAIIRDFIPTSPFLARPLHRSNKSCSANIPSANTTLFAAPLQQARTSLLRVNLRLVGKLSQRAFDERSVAIGQQGSRETGIRIVDFGNYSRCAALQSFCRSELQSPSKNHSRSNGPAASQSRDNITETYAFATGNAASKWLHAIQQPCLFPDRKS